MNEIIINIISVVVTSIVLPLISIAGAKLIQFINSKIKNNKAADLLTTATTIVINAVRSVFQTYVEALKQQGKFDIEAQKTAFQMTSKAVLDILSDDAKEYLTAAVGDLNVYITKKIEAEVNLNK